MLMVCGEALLDVFAAGETRTGLTLDANVGGSRLSVTLPLMRIRLTSVTDVKKNNTHSVLTTSIPSTHSWHPDNIQIY